MSLYTHTHAPTHTYMCTHTQFVYSYKHPNTRTYTHTCTHTHTHIHAHAHTHTHKHTHIHTHAHTHTRTRQPLPEPLQATYAILAAPSALLLCQWVAIGGDQGHSLTHFLFVCVLPLSHPLPFRRCPSTFSPTFFFVFVPPRPFSRPLPFCICPSTFSEFLSACFQNFARMLRGNPRRPFPCYTHAVMFPEFSPSSFQHMYTYIYIYI